MRKFFFGPPPPEILAPETLLVGDRPVPLRLVRHPRARRYLLRLLADGSVRLTVPRGGSVAAARRFAAAQTAWLGQQLARLAQRPARPADWSAGTAVCFRGGWHPLEMVEPGRFRLADEFIRVPAAAPLRAAVETHLRRLAARELPPRVRELAGRHGVAVARVSVRNQKSRWGSCSRRGTISLNWRLIQTPEFVRDYIILHELMHVRQMNHSDRFWREVAGVCPDYAVAERWLKAHGRALRG